MNLCYAVKLSSSEKQVSVDDIDSELEDPANQGVLKSNTQEVSALKWTKKGLVYYPDASLEWARKHALVPTPQLVSDDVIRLYASFCDDNGVGRVGFIEVDSGDPARILRVYDKPVLDIGSHGNFDENGVLPCCVLDHRNAKYLYYVGIQRSISIGYYLFTGLATSQDGGYVFNRYSEVPILDRSDNDLFFRCGPFVMKEKSWKMWYVGGSSWLSTKVKHYPIYRIKYLESNNLASWKRGGWTCFDFKNQDEYGFGRPYVIKDNEAYKMFYSIRTRSRGYRMGYAESRNGRTWVRKDEEVGIDVSDNGWDSGIICYPSVLKVRDKTYMFYNGNYLNSVSSQGQMSIGYAVLEDD